MSQQGLPSGVGLTAISVAIERRAESERPDRLFRDDLAGAFCAAARRAGGSRVYPGFDVALGDLVPLLRGYMALRTRYFDDYLLAAAGAGCRQIVILAAGLDARAFRLSWPPGTRLFELDTPEVLAFKRGVLDETGAAAACERIEVAVDLRTDWPAALRAAGFDPARPTAWLVEGLLIYLTDADNDRLFDAVSALSAPGSRIALEHSSLAMLNTPALVQRRSETLGKVGVAFLSGTDDPVGWLARHGWSATLADGPALAASHGRATPPVLDPAQTDAMLWLLQGTRAEGPGRGAA